MFVTLVTEGTGRPAASSHRTVSNLYKNLLIVHVEFFFMFSVKISVSPSVILLAVEGLDFTNTFEDSVFLFFNDIYLECLGYSNLTSATRKTTYQIPYDVDGSCDSELSEGWFRFQGDAGTKMPINCVPYRMCGTVLPGWLSGSHPTETEGIVSRTVCFTDREICCKHSVSIKVRNCGSHYVYNLPKTRCSRHYCSTD